MIGPFFIPPPKQPKGLAKASNNASPAKVRKRISYIIASLITPSRMAPHKFAPRTAAPKDYFEREIQLPSGHTFELNDQGLADLRQLVADITSLDLCDGLAGYSDVWTATKNVIKGSLAKGVLPENAAELLPEVETILKSTIASRRYVVPLHGLILEGRRSAEFGSFRLLAPTSENLSSIGPDPSARHIAPAMDQLKYGTWLTGKASGTPTVAFERFSRSAELVVGLLAVFTSANFRGGATGFRLHIGASAETSHGRGVYLSWPEGEPSNVTVNYNPSRSQPLRLTSELEARFREEGILEAALHAIESPERTPLEGVVLRAVYWFADAQRDPVPLMQFVKYWSCIESIFSRRDRVVQSVSTGLATVLVAGSYRYFPPKDYKSLKKQIEEMYEARSDALHQGAHLHVSQEDVVKLSQWTAWMLINVIHLTMQGYKTVESLTEQTDRLDRVYSRVSASSLPNSTAS